ncbi:MULTISPECIES: NEL-type E3 ubiquitin ligase domain-containing protein [unclassified Endozoicomonas]|uniref:NEL-type E3 ubiquitin ligase domain-containing protein n=1 Tax=unclassified Endozoicomonas TaxID=2644528 RepID=UPI003BB74076
MMYTNAAASGATPAAATSSHVDHGNAESQRYIPQCGIASYFSETASLEERVAIEVITVTPTELRLLIQQQNFSNGVHYRLEGDFSLDFCPAALPRHLTVTGDLNLSLCEGLRALSGNLTVDGSLILNGLIELETLPEKLSVGRDLSLFRCEALLELSEHLYVGRNLYLNGCRGLRRLPDDLHVGENINLAYCEGLRRLPEQKLNVGGQIILNRCTSLSALPNYITAMGRTSSGMIRLVLMENTGLSDEIIDRLRRARHEGMHFSISRRARQPEQKFSSMEQGLAFWGELSATDAATPELVLRPAQTDHFIEFLQRLTATADYQNMATRPVLAQRVMAVMSLLAGNERVRDDALYRIADAATSCDDRVILALDDLETLQLRTSAETLAVEKHDPTELKALARQMMILDKVKAIARSHMQTQTWVDEIEVELAFRIELGKFFKIPGSTQNMLFRDCACVNDEDIAKARANIEETCTDAALEAFLAQWEPWQKFQRPLAVPPFDQLNPRYVDSIDDCSLFGGKTDKMVGLGNAHVDYDSLVRSYLINGENPFNRTPLDWSEIERLEEVPTPAKNED